MISKTITCLLVGAITLLITYIEQTFDCSLYGNQFTKGIIMASFAIGLNKSIDDIFHTIKLKIYLRGKRR